MSNVGLGWIEDAWTKCLSEGRQICEKYLANGKDVFWAFMDLEKAYDTIDRHGMWQMLRVQAVGGKLFKAVPSLYIDSIVVSWWEIM